MLLLQHIYVANATLKLWSVLVEHQNRLRAALLTKRRIEVGPFLALHTVGRQGRVHQCGAVLARRRGIGMNEGTPEPRTPVMIMVKASWEDQTGTVQNASARIENKSSGGACIRLSKKIDVGTRLMIEGQWERFIGEARYCTKDGRDYLIGIQRDRTERPIAKRPPAKVEASKGDQEASVLPDVTALMERVKEREERKAPEIGEGEKKPPNVPIANIAHLAVSLMPRDGLRETWSLERKNDEQGQGLEGDRTRVERTEKPSVGPETGEERKHMRRKWFDIDMGLKDEKQEGASGNAAERNESPNRAPMKSAAPEPHAMEADREGGPSSQVELLSMDDIYRLAGILNPRKGYSINKIVDMLHSEHLRGVSKEMKRASVLMALDAAGISVEEILQDAKSRRDAIDSYETDQRKQFEAQLARKAEENVQIQTEMERVKARYTERLRRNLDGMAREKTTFGNWLTLKQQEAESMAEAVELCLKPGGAEKPRAELDEVSFSDARVKAV